MHRPLASWAAPCLLLSLACLPVLPGCQQGHTTVRPPLAGVTRSVEALPGEVDPPLLEPAPLLLADDAASGAAPERMTGDNGRCFVCHINYVDEALAAAHACRDIGCADCHGASDEHIADESWASGGNGTAPDIMFRPKEINPACMTCHPSDDLGREQHEQLLAASDTETVCTDCHGRHRLPQRRCRWK